MLGPDAGFLISRTQLMSSDVDDELVISFREEGIVIKKVWL